MSRGVEAALYLGMIFLMAAMTLASTGQVLAASSGQEEPTAAPTATAVPTAIPTAVPVVAEPAPVVEAPAVVEVPQAAAAPAAAESSSQEESSSSSSSQNESTSQSSAAEETYPTGSDESTAQESAEQTGSDETQVEDETAGDSDEANTDDSDSAGSEPQQTETTEEESSDEAVDAASDSEDGTVAEAADDSGDAEEAQSSEEDSNSGSTDEDVNDSGGNDSVDEIPVEEDTAPAAADDGSDESQQPVVEQTQTGYDSQDETQDDSQAAAGPSAAEEQTATDEESAVSETEEQEESDSSAADTPAEEDNSSDDEPLVVKLAAMAAEDESESSADDSEEASSDAESAEEGDAGAAIDETDGSAATETQDAGSAEESAADEEQDTESPAESSSEEDVALAALLEQPLEDALAELDEEQTQEETEETGSGDAAESEIEAEIEAVEEAAGEGDVEQIVEALDDVDAVLVNEDGETIDLTSEEAAALLASQPLVFVPNMGQVDDEAVFYVRSLGGTLYFTQSELVLSLPDAVLRTVLSGANEDAQVSGIDQLEGVYNYLNASSEDDWVTDVSLYSGITYTDIYDGIDVTYEDADGAVKSTYYVDAGIDPSQILWSYVGAESVSIDDDGNLVVTTLGDEEGEVSTVVEEAPVTWQEIDGTKTFVESFYVLYEDGTVGYSFGDYDFSQSLIIDPLTLGYSTYLGGSDNAEVAYDITVDSSGNTYITGQTTSTNFPTSSSYQTDQTGTDAFVTKFNSSGALVYSTYLGGSGTDIGYGIEVDGSGQAYVTGETTSADGFMSANAGGVDAFLTKLNSSGNGVVFSTNLGGVGDDIGYDVALDGSYSAYVTGSTTNNAFVSVAGQGAGGGASDAYVAKYDSSGAFQWSTYLGGAGADIAYGIDVDAGGNSYITGSTDSAVYPTTAGVYDTTANGGTDAFISKLNSTGTALVYSTYFGGAGNDVGRDIAIDSSNQAYIAGYTDGSITTVNGYTSAKPGGTDAFLAKFDTTGVSYLYGTYYGGTGDDFAMALDVDNAGNAYIAGYTTGTLTTSNGYTSTKPGNQDAFVASFNTTSTGSSSLNFATYLGGAANDIANGIAIDSSGNVYVAGETYSSDFPLSSAYDSTLAGGSDAFVTKFIPTSSTSSTTSSTSSSSDSDDDSDDELTPYEAYLQYLQALWDAGYYYYYPYYYPYDWPYDYWTYTNTYGTLTLNSGINYVSLPAGSVPPGSFPYVEMRNLYGLPEVSSSVTVLGQPQGLEVISPYGRYIDWLYKSATIAFRIPDDTEIPSGMILAAQYYDRFTHRWVTMPVSVDGSFAYLSTTRTGTYFLALVPSGYVQTVYPTASVGSSSNVVVTTTTKTVKSTVSGSASLESGRETVVRIVEDSSADAEELVRVEFPAGAASSGSHATVSLLATSALPAALGDAFDLVISPLQMSFSDSSGTAFERLDKSAAVIFTLPDNYDLPSDSMLVAQFYDDETGMWFSLPVSKQGQRVSTMVSRSGTYVLAQTERPMVVDVLDSSSVDSPITLDRTLATSLRFYYSERAESGKSEYLEGFRIEFPADAAGKGGRASLRQVSENNLPAGLDSDEMKLLSQAFDLDLTSASGKSLTDLEEAASLRFKLDADYKVPAGSELAVLYYNQEDGDWFQLPAMWQGDYVFTAVNQPGVFVLALVPQP